MGVAGWPAQAQQPVVIGGGAPNVYVNTQVLDSLGPGYAPTPNFGGYNYGTGYGVPAIPQTATPTAQQPGAPFMVTRPGTLLFPPPQFPRSQVTVQAPAVAFNQGTWPAQAPAAPVTTPPDFPKPVEPELASRVIAPGTEPAPPAPALPAEPAPQMAEAPATEAIAAPPPPTIAETAEATPPAPAVPAVEETAEPAPPPAPEPQDQIRDEPTTVDAGAAPAEATVAGTTGSPQATEPDAPPPPAPEPATAESESELVAPPPPELPPEPETAAPAAPAAPDAPAESTATGTEVAAISPSGLDDDSIRLLFDEGSAELADDAKQALQGLADELSNDGNARVQLLAYASSADNSASRARRLSLSRALAVRAFLIDQGVRSTRMDVRALGNKSEGGPADRVDIMPASR